MSWDELKERKRTAKVSIANAFLQEKTNGQYNGS